MKISRLSLGLVIILIAGCATIFSGTRQTIKVDSNVKGAEVVYNGHLMGVTPFYGEVPKASNPILSVKKEGYVTSEQNLNTKMPFTFWGNVITGGLVGTGTDYSSNAVYAVDPNTYYINLEKEPAAGKEKKEEKREPASTRYDYKKDTQIKQFTMTNFRTLSNEISNGSGEYVDTLVTKIMQMGDDQKAKTIEQLRSILKQSGNDAVKFGESVATYYFRTRSTG